MRKHADPAAKARLVEMLIAEGMLADVDTGESLADLAERGLTNWLSLSWAGSENFDLGFVIEKGLAQCLDLDEQHEAHELEAEIEADLGVRLDEQVVAVSVHTAGQRWMRFGPKVRALECEVEGLGWAALDAASMVGIMVGMCDLSFLEFAAEMSFWGGGSNEQEWADMYGESVEDFQGMTRREFDALIPHRQQVMAKKLTDEELEGLVGVESWVGEVARRVLALRKLGTAVNPFETPKLDEARDFREQLDRSVIVVWDEVEPVRRVLDDYMQGHMEDGGGKDGIGAFALRLDDPNAMLAKTQSWRNMAEQLRHADALLKLIGEVIE